MNTRMLNLFEGDIDRIRADDAYRFLKTVGGRSGKHVTYRGRSLLNLSSNDYLGLASDEALVREFYEKMGTDNIVDTFGPGSSSSRLLTGDYPLYGELERAIADRYRAAARSGREADCPLDALVLSSGYHANTGIIPALAGKGDLILSDRLNHASIIDGIRLSAAGREVFDHLDYGQAADILSRSRERYRKVLIVTESVFSMDGDVADLRGLVELRDRFDAMLYVDEAHAVGVFGAGGLGMCERDGLVGDVDVVVGTFGKALGSLGAFAVTAPVVKEYLVNTVRPFIFTTALPPVVAGWNLFAFGLLERYREKRDALLGTSQRFREAISGAGLATRGSSHIVPIVLGDAARAIRMSDVLQEHGFLVFPIRPPSVPHGSSRIRISLRTDIGWDDIRPISGILAGHWR